MLSRTVLDAGAEVVRTGIGVCCLEVHVQSSGGRVKGVEWMHALNLPGVRVHATCGFAGLDVAPDHWCHVATVLAKC